MIGDTMHNVSAYDTKDADVIRVLPDPDEMRYFAFVWLCDFHAPLNGRLYHTFRHWNTGLARCVCCPDEVARPVGSYRPAED